MDENVSNCSTCSFKFNFILNMLPNIYKLFHTQNFGGIYSRRDREFIYNFSK